MALTRIFRICSRPWTVGVLRSKATGETLEETWEKMSKSKLNGVEPADVVRRHGLEVTRLTMLASVGPHAPRQWNEGESEFDCSARNLTHHLP